MRIKISEHNAKISPENSLPLLRIAKKQTDFTQLINDHVYSKSKSF